jgi:hexosaminidase
MDHYGDSDRNPTPPAAGLPPTLVIEQWLSPVWNWANMSGITGTSYAGYPDAWPSSQHGFRALSTNGWYLDSTPSINEWTAEYTVEPLTNKSCVYTSDAPGATSNCTCTCPEGPWRDGKCYCFDLRNDPIHGEMVLGGEAALWGEHIDESNLMVRAWPRASAVAERLWSRMEVTNTTVAAGRLWRQRCRMLERGVAVTPLNPGFC